jgi:hypothetical protein
MWEQKIQTYNDDLRKGIEDAVKALSKKSLLLGVVKEQGRAVLNLKKRELTNSEIAFVHEFGAPEAHIPARPFFFPTMRAHMTFIQDMLKMAAGAALKGDKEEVDRVLHALGMTLRDAIRKRILDFIPPKLSKVTLEWWITPTKQRKDYGETPLKVTGQLLNSIDYVVSDRV